MLIAASNRVLARLQSLSADLTRAQGPLASLADRIATLRREIDLLEITEPRGARLAARQESLAILDEQWDRETERIRRWLAARDQLHADGVRILTGLGRSELGIREWDTLSAMVRTRIARLAISAPP